MSGRWTLPTVPAGAKTSVGLCNRGDPVTESFMAHWAQKLNPRVATKNLMLDQQLLRVSGRWRPGGQDPDLLVPGDYAPIRAIIAGSMANEVAAHEAALRQLKKPEAVESGTQMVTTLKAQIALLTLAVPFFVDGDTAVGLMGSHPPDEATMAGVRLPFPAVAVFFGAELEFPDDVVWPDEFEETVAAARAAAPLRKNLPWSSYELDIAQAIFERGGKVTGLILVQDDHGALDDMVLWIVSAEPDPNVDPMMQNDRQRSLLIARRSKALWAPLIDNIVAAVNWMPWAEPRRVDLPPDPMSKEWRKAANKGAFRRGEPKGGVIGVRVIDMDTHGRQRPGATGESSRTVVAHLRRGHWRRVRVGPRDDWRYEGRWINPTVVNPGGQGDDRLRVYRVPVPPTEPAPEPVGSEPR